MDQALQEQLIECMEKKNVAGLMETNLGALTVHQFLGEACEQLSDPTNSIDNYGEILGDNFDMIPEDETLERDRRGDVATEWLPEISATCKAETITAYRQMRQWLASHISQKEVGMLIDAVWGLYHSSSTESTQVGAKPEVSHL